MFLLVSNSGVSASRYESLNPFNWFKDAKTASALSRNTTASCMVAGTEPVQLGRSDTITFNVKDRTGNIVSDQRRDWFFAEGSGANPISANDQDTFTTTFVSSENNNFATMLLIGNDPDHASAQCLISFSTQPPGGDTKPSVTLTAVDNQADETGSNTGKFRITRTGSTSSSLSVSTFLTNGTGANIISQVGIDYSSTPTLTAGVDTITIPANNSYIDIVVSPISDNTTESQEQVPLTIDTNNAYTVSGVATSYVYISNSLEQVSKPTFNPLPGGYINGQPVSISASAGGSSSGVIIRYTLDGSDPTSSSTVFSSPINIISTTTIKAKASKSGFSDSEINSGVFEITSCPDEFTNDTSARSTRGAQCPAKGSLILKAVDKSNLGVNGVTFGIINSSGNEIERSTPAGSNQVSISNLSAGNYQVYAKSVNPTGDFVVPSTKQSGTVSSSGSATKTIQISRYGKIPVSVINESNQLIVGAKIVQNPTCEQLYNPAITQKDTNNVGQAIFDSLTPEKQCQIYATKSGYNSSSLQTVQVLDGAATQSQIVFTLRFNGAVIDVFKLQAKQKKGNISSMIDIPPTSSSPVLTYELDNNKVYLIWKATNTRSANSCTLRSPKGVSADISCDILNKPDQIIAEPGEYILEAYSAGLDEPATAKLVINPIGAKNIKTQPPTAPQNNNNTPKLDNAVELNFKIYGEKDQIVGSDVGKVIGQDGAKKVNQVAVKIKGFLGGKKNNKAVDAGTVIAKTVLGGVTAPIASILLDNITGYSLANGTLVLYKNKPDRDSAVSKNTISASEFINVKEIKIDVTGKVVKSPPLLTNKNPDPNYYPAFVFNKTKGSNSYKIVKLQNYIERNLLNQVTINIGSNLIPTLPGDLKQKVIGNISETKCVDGILPSQLKDKSVIKMIANREGCNG